MVRQSRNRSGMSLTYKLLVIMLVLTLIPTTLVALSSLNTFTTIDETVFESIDDIKDTAIDEAEQTKAAAISQTTDSLTDIMTDDLEMRRDDKLDKYSAMLESVEQEAEVVSGYAETNWGQFEDTTPSPTFDGLAWAGPENTADTRQNQQPELHRLSHLGDLLEELDNSNELTSLTYFGTPNNNVVISQDIEETLEAGDGFNAIERPWYEEVSQTGETEWITSYVDANTGELVLTVSAPAYLDGELIGISGIDLQLDTVMEDILETDPGFAFMLDETGEAVVYPGMQASEDTTYAEETFRGTNFIEDDVSDDMEQLAESMVGGETGMEEVDIEGQASFVAYGPLEENNWSVGVAVPVEDTLAPIHDIESDLQDRLTLMSGQIEDKSDDVMEDISDTTQQTIYRYSILFILLIIVVIGSGVYISRHVTRPIIELQEKAESISKGGIGKELDIHTGDELEELGDSFNRVIRTIKILQERDSPQAAAAKQRDVREAQKQTDAPEDPGTEGVGESAGSDTTPQTNAEQATPEQDQPEEDMNTGAVPDSAPDPAVPEDGASDTASMEQSETEDSDEEDDDSSEEGAYVSDRYNE